MIRDRRWKYVHRYPWGPHELYDLLNDPEERENPCATPAGRGLVDCPKHAETVREMKAQLDAWFVRYVDPRAGPAGQGRKVFADDWRYLSGAPKPKLQP